jgi:Zn-dependent protease with chaperone function
MRAVLAIFFLAYAITVATPAESAESIHDVLQRSQQMQLDALTKQQIDASDPRVAVIQTSFERVLHAVRTPSDVRLIVVKGPLLAVCLMGSVVAANVSIAELSEAERTFILAHEVGHIALDHWAQLGALYQEHIPGEVVQEKTDPVAAVLGRDASAMAHRHEFEADAFALRLLRFLGEPEDTPMVLFLEHLPLVRPTATHPGTHQRLAQIRTLMH